MDGNNFGEQAVPDGWETPPVPPASPAPAAPASTPPAPSPSPFTDASTPPAPPIIGTPHAVTPQASPGRAVPADAAPTHTGPPATPVLSGDYGVAEPPVAPDAPAPSRAPWFAAVAGAVVLVCGAAFFAASALGASGGAATPEEAVDAMLTALENEDFITLAEILEPAERRSVAEPILTEVVPELQRIGVLDQRFDSAAVDGVDFEIVDATYRVEPLADHPDLVHVYFTGGEFVSEFDADAFPLGAEFREAFPDEFQDEPRVAEDMADDVPMVLVERDGRWYVSGLFSMAESWRLSADERLPLAAEAPVALGSPSPSAAVEAMIDEIVDFDLRGMIGRTDPAEMAVLYRYSPLFLDEAQGELDDARLELLEQGISWGVTDVVLDEEIDGDDATVFVRAFTATISGDDFTAEFTYSTELIRGAVDAGASTNGSMSITPRSFRFEAVDNDAAVTIEATFEPNEAYVSGVADGEPFEASLSIDPDGVCSRYSVVAPDLDESGCLESEDLLGERAAAYVAQYRNLLEELDDGFPALPVATRLSDDGLWYVAPVSTVIDGYVGSLERIEPGDFDAMIALPDRDPLGIGDLADALAEVSDPGTIPIEAEPDTGAFEPVEPRDDVGEVVDVMADPAVGPASIDTVTTVEAQPGSLTISDDFRENTYDVVEVVVVEGGELVIAMQAEIGTELDPYLTVITPDGREFVNDDAPFDSGLGIFDSQVVVDDAPAGTYIVQAGSYRNMQAGTYSLTVELR